MKRTNKDKTIKYNLKTTTPGTSEITIDSKLFDFSKFIIMKVGSHGDESFEQIINRKNCEQEKVGFMLWGYSGNFLDVIQTRKFLNSNNPTRAFILMSNTKSPFKNNPIRSNFFSLDKEKWNRLPEFLFTSGCDKAVVCRNLIPTDFNINLSNFRVAVGPSKGKLLSDYLKYRVDKACVYFSPNKQQNNKNIIKINWIAEILPPYTIYLSNSLPPQISFTFDRYKKKDYGVFFKNLDTK